MFVPILVMPSLITGLRWCLPDILTFRCFYISNLQAMIILDHSPTTFLLVVLSSIDNLFLNQSLHWRLQNGDFSRSIILIFIHWQPSVNNRFPFLSLHLSFSIYEYYYRVMDSLYIHLYSLYIVRINHCHFVSVKTISDSAS